MVFNTEMHWVTLIFVLLELVMFGVHLGYYLNRPKDKRRKWYLILLGLLIIYNVTGGLFPDPALNIPVFLQNIFAYGTGFITASYFPYYFYKAFDLKLLRFHALYGVPLFLLLPYMIFFVISYSINDDLAFAIKYGVIAPFLYSFVLLWAIFRAIRERYKQNRKHKLYAVEISVYCAVSPWAVMTLIAYFGVSQLAEVLIANVGFLVITAMFIAKQSRSARSDHNSLENMRKNGNTPKLFLANCLHFVLTKTEILIVQLVYKGLGNKEIAGQLLISEETVKKHVQNVLRKTGARNRSGMISKLHSIRPD